MKKLNQQSMTEESPYLGGFDLGLGSMLELIHIFCSPAACFVHSHAPCVCVLCVSERAVPDLTLYRCLDLGLKTRSLVLPGALYPAFLFFESERRVYISPHVQRAVLARLRTLWVARLVGCRGTILHESSA